MSAVGRAEATDVGLLVEVLAESVADGIGIVLIDFAGRVVVHDLLADVGAALDDGLCVAHGLDGWGVARGVAFGDA